MPSKVLIVDDEKNIRFTFTQALEPLALEVDNAFNGDEALRKMGGNDYQVILLDLKMPGMDGMEVLRWVSAERPQVRVIIITAHGTVESAVEAMKLGAVDFLQKPFSPTEIREIVKRVLERSELPGSPVDFGSAMELSKKAINERHFPQAMEHLTKAISFNPSSADAFNLMGLLLEIQGKHKEAQQQYRAALSFDPGCESAKKNLHRVTQFYYEPPSLEDIGI